jgi:SAM-dependent methyltransferase
MMPACGQELPGASSYAPLFFERLLEVEDHHFWFRARNRVIRALVTRALSRAPKRPRVLEIGCGNGNVLRTLTALDPPARVTGMDLFLEGLRLARRRVPCPLVVGDIRRPPFSSPFDLIGCFDVLEHLTDDEAALRSLHEALASGGALVVSVPAHPWLWSDFDIASHHERRYEDVDLRSKLSRAGFTTEFLSPYMSLLLPPAWTVRRLRPSVSTRGESDLGNVYRQASRDLRVVPILNGLLELLLAPEASWLGRFRRLPFGTSFVALARRANSSSS